MFLLFYGELGQICCKPAEEGYLAKHRHVAGTELTASDSALSRGKLQSDCSHGEAHGDCGDIGKDVQDYQQQNGHEKALGHGGKNPAKESNQIQGSPQQERYLATEAVSERPSDTQEKDVEWLAYHVEARHPVERQAYSL